MSNFTSPAINPSTGEIEQAHWLDDYFGRDQFGIRFQDGSVWPEHKVKTPGNAGPTDRAAQRHVEGRGRG